MSNEELMQSRAILTNPYQNSPFEVGEILYADSQGWFFYYDDEGRCEIYPLSYPANFRKLEWWEYRKAEDMPEYVKEGDDVYKVHTWDGTKIPFVYINDVKRDHYVWGSESAPVYGDILPATLQEYEAFINKK